MISGYEFKLAGINYPAKKYYQQLFDSMLAIKSNDSYLLYSPLLTNKNSKKMQHVSKNNIKN